MAAAANVVAQIAPGKLGITDVVQFRVPIGAASGRGEVESVPQWPDYIRVPMVLAEVGWREQHFGGVGDPAHYSNCTTRLPPVTSSYNALIVSSNVANRAEPRLKRLMRHCLRDISRLGKVEFVRKFQNLTHQHHISFKQEL
jgi:hypothetical protein